MCPIVFQGHLSNFKVSLDKKPSILTQIGRFRTITLVWIHWWLWNDAQSLKQHRRGALSFFKVIRQISRSHGTKNRQFWPELSVSGLQLRFEFTNGFEMMLKAWCNIEEVPNYFSRSSIKFQGHMGWKIDDFDQIWARLLGRSQLSNPSDLPCWINNRVSAAKTSMWRHCNKWHVSGPRCATLLLPCFATNW